MQIMRTMGSLVHPEDQVIDVPEHESSSHQTSPSVATPHVFSKGTEDEMNSSLGPPMLYEVGQGDADIIFLSPKLEGRRFLQSGAFYMEDSHQT